jgi:Kef-type K+ transport system membrane component KefB
VIKPIFHRIIDLYRVAPMKLHLDLLAIVLAAIFISGLFTYKLGIFAIFGGFMIGVILYNQTKFVTAWKNKIADFVTVFFLPIFFTYTGLRTNVHGLNSVPLWAWCVAMIGAATFGKFAGCYAAARFVGLNHNESSCIGIMMNTRALMELIILNIGYDLGIIPPNVFTMLVLMAIFSTVITSPFLRRWLPKMGHVIPHHRDG